MVTTISGTSASQAVSTLSSASTGSAKSQIAALQTQLSAKQTELSEAKDEESKSEIQESIADLKAQIAALELQQSQEQQAKPQTSLPTMQKPRPSSCPGKAKTSAPRTLTRIRRLAIATRSSDPEGSTLSQPVVATCRWAQDLQPDGPSSDRHDAANPSPEACGG